MNIGITTNKEYEKKLLAICQEVAYVDLGEQTAKKFYEFIEENSGESIYTYQLSDIGLQLVQLIKIFELLEFQNKIIYFMDKGLLNHLNDEIYFKVIKNLVRNEHKIMTVKTHLGMNNARENGIRLGRPAVSSNIIEEIQDLHIYQKKSIREIAEICNVSVGTAHKYIHQSNES